MTFYRSSEELPDFADYCMEGRTYRYMKNQALYPFGYGLSYTSFAYTEVRAVSGRQEAGAVKEAAVIVREDGITIGARVKNTGAMAGAETVQVYVKICQEGTPNAQLKGIRKVFLSPGEEKEVSIHLPREAFGLYDGEGRFQVVPGMARVYVGGHGPDVRSEELTGQKVTELVVRI